jgi:hypothetical protein
MTDPENPQPNKPDGERSHGGDRPAEELQAVKNQASVSPDDYPEGSDGKPVRSKP